MTSQMYYCAPRMLSFQKHAKLVKSIYPKSSSLDVAAKESELSKLLYYCKSKPSKLPKVTHYLCIRTASDIRHCRLGYVKLNLLLCISLVKAFKASIYWFAPNVLKIINLTLNSAYSELYGLAIEALAAFFENYDLEVLFDRKVFEASNSAIKTICMISSNPPNDSGLQIYSIKGFEIIQNIFDNQPFMARGSNTVEWIYGIFEMLMENVFECMRNNDKDEIRKRLAEISRQLDDSKTSNLHPARTAFQNIDPSDPNALGLMSYICLITLFKRMVPSNAPSNLIIEYMESKNVKSDMETLESLTENVLQLIQPSAMKSCIVKLLSSWGSKLTMDNALFSNSIAILLSKYYSWPDNGTRVLDLQIVICFIKKLLESCSLIVEHKLSYPSLANKGVISLHKLLKSNIVSMMSSGCRSNKIKYMYRSIINTAYLDITNAIYPDGLTRSNIKSPAEKNSECATHTIITLLDVMVLTSDAISTHEKDFQSDESPKLTHISDKTSLDKSDFDIIFTFTVVNLLPLFLRDNSSIRKKTLSALHAVIKQMDPHESLIPNNNLYVHFNKLIPALPKYLHVYFAFYGKKFEDCVIWCYLLNYLIVLEKDHRSVDLVKDTFWAVVSAATNPVLTDPEMDIRSKRLFHIFFNRFIRSISGYTSLFSVFEFFDRNVISNENEIIIDIDISSNGPGTDLYFSHISAQLCNDPAECTLGVKPLAESVPIAIKSLSDGIRKFEDTLSNESSIGHAEFPNITLSKKDINSDIDFIVNLFEQTKNLSIVGLGPQVVSNSYYVTDKNQINENVDIHPVKGTVERRGPEVKAMDLHNYLHGVITPLRHKTRLNSEIKRVGSTYDGDTDDHGSPSSYLNKLSDEYSGKDIENFIKSIILKDKCVEDIQTNNLLNSCSPATILISEPVGPQPLVFSQDASIISDMICQSDTSTT